MFRHDLVSGAEPPAGFAFLAARVHLHRQMDGERLYITYGERNLIRSFRSVKVETRSDPATPKGAPSKTWSDNLLADFGKLLSK